MYRLSHLLRNRRLGASVTMRAGVPGWDRPDVPPSAVVEKQELLTDEEIILNFPDQSMPEYFLTQPEVYEGDTLLEATPSLLEGFGIIFGVALSIGTSLYLVANQATDLRVGSAQVERYQQEEEELRTNRTLNLSNQNPIGLKNYTHNVTSINPAIRDRYQSHQYIMKTNQQVQTYLTHLKAKCSQKVLSRKHSHAEQSHVAEAEQ